MAARSGTLPPSGVQIFIRALATNKGIFRVGTSSECCGPIIGSQRHSLARLGEATGPTTFVLTVTQGLEKRPV